MGKKIFVSYKFADDDVEQLAYNYNAIAPIKTTVRTYVNKLEEIIGIDNIYKGEHDGEDLSRFKDDTIWSQLKDKIFDSSVTIVLISKNMKEFWVSEEKQWIPQEISYSLKEFTRTTKDGRREIKSKTNALIAIVLPDRNGLYDYYIRNSEIINKFNQNITFDIINENMYNKKGNPLESYIVTTKWNHFISNPQKYIDMAVEHQENIANYNISKQIK